MATIEGDIGTGEIKGRGNYTWTLAKKPYQIKLDGSKPVLGMGAAKTWILLANYADASLMRNKLAYDLGASLGLHGSPDSRWVDLRINGEYRGNYLITEKVEVKKNRVELASPQGILAELDHRGDGSQPGYPAEDYWFHTATSNSTFTLKDAKSDIPDKDVAPLPADTAGGLGGHEGDPERAGPPALPDDAELGRHQRHHRRGLVREVLLRLRDGGEPRDHPVQRVLLQGRSRGQALRRAGVGLRQRRSATTTRPSPTGRTTARSTSRTPRRCVPRATGG